MQAVSRIALACCLLVVVSAVRLGDLTRLRGPASAEEVKVDAKNGAISDRIAKEEYCAEKKCKETSGFWCAKQCSEKESECPAGSKEAALKEVASKTACEQEKKSWCKGKCHAKAAECKELLSIDCNNIHTASPPAATGAATGATGPAPKKAAATTTAAPATVTTTEAPADEDEKKPVTMTACEMVKPWETNQFYLKHVLPGPPKSKSFCCLAMIRELANRVGALADKLANCEPKDSEECMKLAAELASLKALLGKYQKNSGYTDKEVEKTAVNANDFDKKMTKDWTDHKDYKTYVEGDVHKATKNLTTAMQMSPQEEVRYSVISMFSGVWLWLCV